MKVNFYSELSEIVNSEHEVIITYVKWCVISKKTKMETNSSLKMAVTFNEGIPQKLEYIPGGKMPQRCQFV